MVEFTTVPRIDLSDAVVERLRDAIVLGRLRPGDSLPSERALSVQLGVNRTTVREALFRLEMLGLIDRVHGRRCKVLDFRRNGSTSLVPHLVRLGIDGAAESFVESVAVVYEGTVALAVQRATPDDVTALEETVDDLDDAITREDRPAVIESDRAFHQRIAAASHSVVLELMMAGHYRTLDGSFDVKGHLRDAQSASLIERHRQGKPLPHRLILQAIVAGDEARARRLAVALVTRSPRRGQGPDR